jgi:hypothetical protein
MRDWVRGHFHAFGVSDIYPPHDLWANNAVGSSSSTVVTSIQRILLEEMNLSPSSVNASPLPLTIIT